MIKQQFINSLLLGMLISCTPKSDEVKEASVNPEPAKYVSFTEKVNSKEAVISAHRGDWYRFSENSLPGIKSCYEAGIDVVEIDIQFTKDDVAVLMHDKTLDRTTTGHGLVSALPFDSLKQLNLRNSALGTLPYKIPTLEEVLNLYNDKDIYFNIDKVTGDFGRYQKVLQLLEKTGTLDQCIFWAPYPFEDAKHYFGNFLNQTNVVPFITDKLMQTEDAILFIDEYLNHMGVPFVYVCLSNLDDKAEKLINHLKSKNVNLGCAPTWDRMSFGYSDRVSVVDPQQGWVKLKHMGFKFFETNYPFYLKEAFTIKAQ